MAESLTQEIEKPAKEKINEAAPDLSLKLRQLLEFLVVFLKNLLSEIKNQLSG